MNESNEDRLIGEWHELARVVEVGAPVGLPAATGVLNEVLRTFAPTPQSPRYQAEILPLKQTLGSWKRHGMRASGKP